VGDEAKRQGKGKSGEERGRKEWVKGAAVPKKQCSRGSSEWEWRGTMVWKGAQKEQYSRNESGGAGSMVMDSMI
jgi:hypothetical protein